MNVLRFPHFKQFFLVRCRPFFYELVGLIGQIALKHGKRPYVYDPHILP